MTFVTTDIFFNITIRRRTLFYTVNLIVPCVGISYLSVLVFYLPADSGEKIILSITILLSQTMFFLLVSEIMPSTSLALPLLGKYLLFTMFLIGLCVIITIVILNIHYRKPSTHKMAPWIRYMFIKKLPKLLLMRVPQQLLVDIRYKHVILDGNNHVKHHHHHHHHNMAISAPTSASSSPPDSVTRYRSGSCINLHSLSKINNNHHHHGRRRRSQSFLPVMLNSNYFFNNHRSCSGAGVAAGSIGLEDNFRDFILRRKYPFELEKAMHNIKFIQHHLHRQDEFTAVSDFLFLIIISFLSLN